ncbi:hypothetical protein KW790_00950 [Candidatus Parcubacteria bacterium]|nr:hypothetical protein [Candidatus Parcubacteria bacterium]
MTRNRHHPDFILQRAKKPKEIKAAFDRLYKLLMKHGEASAECPWIGRGDGREPLPNSCTCVSHDLELLLLVLKRAGRWPRTPRRIVISEALERFRELKSRD